MKILIDIKHKKQFMICNNFKIGLSKHNIKNVTIINSKKIHTNELKKTINEYDLIIGWGVKSMIYKFCQSYNKDFLVLERGYLLDRYKWTSCGYNGLNNHANFYNQNIDSTRWNNVFSHQMSLLDWSDSGEYALIAGQVKRDASVKHLSIYNIYQNLIKELNTMNIPVVFRPHPLEKYKHLNDITNLKFTYDKNHTLEDTLKKARFTITINSNAGVISLTKGIPVISLDNKSMVYDYSSHSIFSNLIYPDRLPWCHRMAYTQWSFGEIKNGETWNHLKQRYQ